MGCAGPVFTRRGAPWGLLGLDRWTRAVYEGLRVASLLQRERVRRSGGHFLVVYCQPPRMGV